MNPYQFSTTCDVCGGEGVGTIKTAAAAWDARRMISHRDPRICRDNIERAKKAAAAPVTVQDTINRVRKEVANHVTALFADLSRDLGLTPAV